MEERTKYILPAFIIGWLKPWNLTTIEQDKCFDINNSDLFRATIMPLVEGREREQFNKKIALLFGEVVTKVKTFPTSDGTWIILDKHTKRLLHKDIKNENDVDLLCKQNGYIR
jgi:hypothetical protein